MPSLRKRKAVSYIDDDEEEDDGCERQQNSRKSNPKPRKSKTALDDDAKEGWKKRSKSAQKPLSRKKSALNNPGEPSGLLLSDSGCDSEPDLVAIRPPKAKRKWTTLAKRSR